MIYRAWDFVIYEEEHMISIPYTWMEKYGISHLPLHIFRLWKY